MGSRYKDIHEKDPLFIETAIALNSAEERHAFLLFRFLGSYLYCNWSPTNLYFFPVPTQQPS